MLSALANLALTYMRLGNPRRAVQLLEPHLAIAREMGYRAIEGVAVGRLALVYSQLGDHNRAVSFAERQLRVARALGNLADELEALATLATEHRSLGNVERSLAREAELFRVLGAPIPPSRNPSDESADAGRDAADTQLSLPPDFVEELEREIEIARDDGKSGLLRARLGVLALAHLALGHVAEGVKRHEEQLALIRAGGDRGEEIRYMFSFAGACLTLGLEDIADQRFAAARNVAREIGARQVEAVMCWQFGLAYEARGELAKGADLMQICVDYEREIGHADAEKHSAYLAALRVRIAKP